MPKVGEQKPFVLPPEGLALGINLYDCDRLPDMLKGILLGGKVDLRNAVWIDRTRPDETAVVFTCDLLTAASSCDVIRNYDRQAKDYPTRVYLRRVKAWERLSGEALLTTISGGKVKLNPNVFPPQQAAVVATAPKSRRLV